MISQYKKNLSTLEKNGRSAPLNSKAKYFEKISKSDISHPKVERFQKKLYHLKAFLNAFQMSTNVMGLES
jgi:hypothetical protein